MNVDNIYDSLSQIYQRKNFDNQLLNKLKSENLSKSSITIKIYILEFLIDQEDDLSSINNYNDIWFIKDNVTNVDIYLKYIELMINLIKEGNLAKINIYKEIEIFIDNNEYGNKIFYLLAILNKFYLPDLMILLFIGFVLGEKKEFIKKNYSKNVLYLCSTAKFKLNYIDFKANIFSLNEGVLEIINIYFFFKLYLKKDANSINSFENFLQNIFKDDFDLKVYYKKLEKSEMLQYIFYNEDNLIDSNSYKNKATILIKNIKENIKNINIEEQLLSFEEEEEEVEEETHEIFDNGDKKIFLIQSNQQLNESNISTSQNPNKNMNINENANVLSNENKIIENKVNINEVNKDKTNQEDVKNNKIDNINENLPENPDKTDINSNATENKIIKGTNSISSTNSKTSDEDSIFQHINNFIDYPKYSELKIILKECDKTDDFIEGSAFYLLIQLNNKISEIKNILSNSILDVNIFIEKIELESKLRLLSMENLRLEILINFLKNPNIINIKRKILEIINFHLYYENYEYFDLNDDYSPKIHNLEELEKLINLKILKDNKNKKALNDLKKIQNEKINIVSGKKGLLKPKINRKIDENKKRKLLIAKEFLDFYKHFLDSHVQSSQDTIKYFLLPRKMFNSETNENKYIFDLESFLSEKNKIPEIVGLNRNEQVINLKIYNYEKHLEINEALDILFPFKSKNTNIEIQISNIIKKKKNEYIKNIKKMKEIYQELFMIDFKPEDGEKCTDFKDEINKQINEYANIFEKEVLNKLYKLVEKIFEGAIDDQKKNIIYYLKNFFSKLLEKYRMNLLKKNEFLDLNKLLYFLSVRILILNKTIIFFNKSKKYFENKLKAEEEKYNEMMIKVDANLNQLKKIIENNKNFEVENDAYENWIRKVSSSYNNKDEISLESLKEYFKNNIKKKLNLEMNFIYDTKFCLWAIKSEFGGYFFN